MARLDEIRGLAEYHAAHISSSPRDWMNYLDTAARLYRYPFMVQLYKTTLPESIKVYCFNTEKALRKLPEADASQKNYLVIFKYTTTVEQLIKAGYRLSSQLNIGPQSVREGSTFIMPMIGLLPEEVQALDTIEKAGTKIILNPQFMTPNFTWRTVSPTP